MLLSIVIITLILLGVKLKMELDPGPLVKCTYNPRLIRDG